MWKREKVWSWQQSRREVEAWTKRSRRLESVKTSLRDMALSKAQGWLTWHRKP